MKDKEKQIEEMAKIIQNACSKCSECEIFNTDKFKHIESVECDNLKRALDTYNAGYRKVDKDSVVISREELTKRDYEFRKIGYDECLRDNPQKDKYIKKLEHKIDKLNAKLDQARKRQRRF